MDPGDDYLPPCFTVLVTGQIESADLLPASSVSAALLPWPFPGLAAALVGGGGWGRLSTEAAAGEAATRAAKLPTGSAYCRFELVAGEDWALAHGHDGGTTQLARPSGCGWSGGGVGGSNNDDSNNSSPSGGRPVRWNHPIDACFRSTSPFGWPQITLAVYGVDPATGRDVVRGYGAAPLPASPGRHRLRVRLFRPRAATAATGAAGWWSGRPAEFADARTPSYGVGRAGERRWWLLSC
jgi:hypothetical protein